MSDRWVGRVALVTGASVGIGAAIVRKLVGHGMTVVGCDHNGFDNVKTIAAELTSQNAPGLLHPVKCDVSKEADILAMFAEIKDKFGGVDVCVNNAGLSFDCPLLSGKTEHWRYMLEVNVLAVAICTREAIRQMAERGIDDGHIFYMNSLSGHRVPGPGATTGFYCGNKHMITAMTEGLRQELRKKKSNIRTTCISPGNVETQFLISMLGEEKGKEIYKQMKNLEADDIANSIVHALHAPPHCEIHDILIRPIEQED